MQRVLDVMSKTQCIREQIKKFNLIKIQTFFSMKGPIKMITRQAAVCKKNIGKPHL